MFTCKQLAARASVACLLLGLSVAPLFSQAVAEQKQSVEGFVASIRQAKINPERDAYMALYSEQVPAKKIELAGKFLTDYPGTELKMFVYQMQIDSYQRLGNIEKLVKTGEKFAADFPNFWRRTTGSADNNIKKFVMQRMMTAYQQKNDLAETVEYGERVLAIDPKDLPSLLVLSSTLSERLPTEEEKKAAQLDKALEYSTRAIAEIEALQKPAPMPDELWTTEKNKLLATVNVSIDRIKKQR